MKLTIAEALKLVPVQRPTLYRHIKEGKLTAELDAQGRKVIDTAELQRFYGTLSNGQPTETPGTDETDTKRHPDTDRDDVITLLREQVHDLKSQLETATGEKAKLLELSDRLQKQNELLMLPAPEHVEKKARGWLQRLIGA